MREYRICDGGEIDTVVICVETTPAGSQVYVVIPISTAKSAKSISAGKDK